MDDLQRRGRLAEHHGGLPVNDFGLTRRELDVLQVLGARALQHPDRRRTVHSGNTVVTAVARILTKLGVTTCIEGATRARETGLL